MLNFDGSFKSKPSINLSGQSKMKTRDELIKQAANERQKRETEKRQQAASIRIQSAYRSYLVRKNLKNNNREEFDRLFDASSANMIGNIRLLLPLFVRIYKHDEDKERLAKLSHSIVLNKKHVVNILADSISSNFFVFTFSKFLVINLKTLNLPSTSSHATALRIIDCFTDPQSFMAQPTELHGSFEKNVLFIFNYLIKNGFINELTQLAIRKIPYMVNANTRVPLASSIVELISRSFIYLDSNHDSIQSNRNIVSAICNELFIKSNMSQIRYCIIELLSKKFLDNIKQTSTTNARFFSSDLNKLNLFVDLLNELILNNELKLSPILNEQAKKTSNKKKLINLDSASKLVSLKDQQRVNFRNNLLVLFCLLRLFYHLIEQFSDQQFKEFLRAIHQLISQLKIINEESVLDMNDEYESNADRHESNHEPMDTSFRENEMRMSESQNELTSSAIEQESAMSDGNDPIDLSSVDEKIYDQQQIIESIFSIFNSKVFSNKVDATLASTSTSSSSSSSSLINEYCLSISQICHFIILKSHLKIHQSLLLRTMAFNKFFLASLWRTVCTLSIKPNQSQNVELYLIQMLASGTCTEIYDNELSKIVAPLSTFCSLYNLFLLPILDREFLNGEAIFSKIELIKMSAILKDICLGIIRLMHPDAFHSVKTNADKDAFESKLAESNRFKQLYALHSLNSSGAGKSNEEILYEMKLKAVYFTHLFQACSQLVQRMYLRDIRFGFCPEDHWISNSIVVTAARLATIFESQDSSILNRIKFGQLSYLLQDDMDIDHRLSVSDIRSLTVLQELPFAVPFKERVSILSSFIELEPNFSLENTLKIRIRRDYLYEDAFENLSKTNAPNLKTMRVSIEMINRHGLDEAGVDGGGLFREFILQLLENGFDPNRGFFMTTSDGFLYPNPNIKSIFENYREHYYFLGRILGKAIQCKILSSIKFAGFFLQKILSKSFHSRLDIDYLASLDPQIYNNLLYLKDLKTDVSALDLNFALDVSEFGETKTIELKPGGKDIIVTNDNRIEYIHLLADFKLNQQINDQVIPFRNGMSDIIDLELLRLFNFNELQNLISGSVDLIDVNDWKLHTVYQGIYRADHPVIINFWKIVNELSEENKHRLLKFATSRSRPPLFGFKNLIPNFAIHNSGNEDRLPTASTCMNLLKLPQIEDYELLKKRLIFAIESDSGFDLS